MLWFHALFFQWIFHYGCGSVSPLAFRQMYGIPSRWATLSKACFLHCRPMRVDFCLHELLRSGVVDGTKRSFGESNRSQRAVGKQLDEIETKPMAWSWVFPKPNAPEIIEVLKCGNWWVPARWLVWKTSESPSNVIYNCESCRHHWLPLPLEHQANVFGRGTLVFSARGESIYGLVSTSTETLLFFFFGSPNLSTMCSSRLRFWWWSQRRADGTSRARHFPQHQFVLDFSSHRLFSTNEVYVFVSRLFVDLVNLQKWYKKTPDVSEIYYQLPAWLAYFWDLLAVIWRKTATSRTFDITQRGAQFMGWGAIK